MNEFSLKLHQGIQAFKENQKFKEAISYNPKTLPLPSMSAIPIAGYNNNNSLPSANNMKLTIRERTKSDVRLRRATINQLASTRKLQVRQKASNDKDQKGSLDDSSRKNLIHKRQKRISSGQGVRSHKSLLKKQPQNSESNNFQLIIKQKDIYVTPIKLANTEAMQTTNFKGIKNSSSKPSTKSKTILLQNLMKNMNDELLLNVKFGVLQQNASYKSFLNAFKSEDGRNLDAEHTLTLLKSFIIRNKIQSGIVEGKELGKLVHKKVLSNYQLVCTFSNKSQIIKLYPICGLQYYQTAKGKGKNLAATKIQSLFHLVVARNYAMKLKSLMKKVKIIQRIWRHCLLAKRTRKKILQSIENKIKISTKLTQNMIQQWEIIRSSPRVEIHIAAYCMEQFKRLTTVNLAHHQNAQLTRIFRAIESDITVIYVTPIVISEEIMKYYERIFTINKALMNGKLYVINPENSARLPGHLTTVSQLLYSPKALRRIKTLVASSSCQSINCYIVPSLPSIQYANLSAVLGIPILSSAQTKHKVYSNKCFFRSIMEKASIPTLKCLHSIYSQKQLINSLAILIYRNPEVKKWYLKIDDEIRGRGLAIVNCDSFAFLREIRNSEQLEQQVTEKDMIRLIAEQLTKKMKRKLKIICRQVYPTYQQYMAHFATRGGIIEAETIGKSIQYSISFIIEPNGEFKILGTYHKMQLGGRPIEGAIKSPARIYIDLPSLVQNNKSQLRQEYLVSSNEIQKIVRALYKQIYMQLKMFGYFSVDLLHEEETRTSYAIGLDCYLNEQTCSLYAVQFCSQCSYDKDVNCLFRKQQIGGGQLHYVYCPLLKIPGMPHINVFFKRCKYGNISFDLIEKLGVMFMLLDNLESGVIGLLCIEKSQDSLYETLRRSSQYLSKEFHSNNSLNPVAKGKKNELGLLKGMALVMGRKYKKKQEATKQDVDLAFLF